MPARIMMIWDYDTPITSITATRPYNYDFEVVWDEAKNVDSILDYGKSGDVKMTFAVVGYGAEKTVPPFDVRDKIIRIYSEGHEVASHSWKHEWFPYLTKYQIKKSIERSKLILEDCLGAKGIIKGFVPPHDRPMSWPGKFAWSLGDRALFPFHPGASIGYIARELKRQEFEWYRTTFRPFWNKLTDWKGSNFEERLKRNWGVYNGIVCFSGTFPGFGPDIYKIVDRAVKNSLPVVIVGHPAGLSRKGHEYGALFDQFFNYVVKLKKAGDATTHTISDYIQLSGLRGKL